MHAANAMLYPLTWQHIFLPLMPAAFIDYLTAPMPFLVGLPAALMPAMRQLPTEEVFTLVGPHTQHSRRAIHRILSPRLMNETKSCERWWGQIVNALAALSTTLEPS